jgi:FAD/FMN-containing dehydrogenase
VAALASEVIASHLDPVLVCAVPLDGDGNDWRLLVGFEGFSDTVQAQSDRLYRKMNPFGLAPAAPASYAVLEGPLADGYSSIDASRFQLKMDLPAAVVAEAYRALASLAEIKHLVLDLGCGRILAGSDALSGESWQKIGASAAAFGGHAILEAAPPEFKAEHDIFGPERSDWKLMHRVKRAFDPRGIFGPGRLPGRV